jgi:heme exporter protein C
MRTKLLIALTAIAGLLLFRNIYVMMLELPDEAAQGAIYRIIFFHVPAAWTALIAATAAGIASILYLVTKNLKYDTAAVAVTEVGLAFGAINLITGMIWGRIIWGIWWTWDARLTSMLVCWLLYAGYLMLRQAIDDPTQRARIAAVLSIFAFADVPIVIFSIKWWRTQHPQPVVWGGGSMDPAMKAMLFQNWIPILLIALVFVMIRMRQEQQLREIDAIRRFAHAY